MEIIRGIDQIRSKHQHQAVVLGFFDGLHRGHQALIEKARFTADQSSPKSRVLLYTFDRHPLEIVDPARVPPLLTILEEKIKLASKFPLDYFLIDEFSQELSNLEPQVFLETIVAQILKPKNVIIGFNYRYGKDHQGNASTLLLNAKKLGIDVTVVEPEIVNQAPISSTRIRTLLREGNVGEAESLLGRRYSVQGKVVRGEGRGKALGVPTANLEIPQEKLIPRSGVYLGLVQVDGGKFGGLISVGKCPTFGGERLVVEAHLLDFQGNLYGKEVEIEFVAWCRDQETFASPEALAEKMKEDIALGRSLLASY